MKRYLPYLLLLVVSALTYLPFVGRFTYANDDWYLMYGAHVQGADYFAPAYERDRPLRAYVLGPAYNLFGDDPLPYHVSAYAFRFLSAVSLFWLLNQVWPLSLRGVSGANDEATPSPARGLLRREDHPPRNDGYPIPNYQSPNLPITNLLITLLFLLYPGFLSQPNPIDYQSQIVSLFAAMTSLALTVAALKTPKLALKVVYLILSFLLAWVYLGLIEYYLGLEVLRLLVIFIVLRHKTNYALRFTQYAIRTIIKSIPSLLGPLTFLIWRFFFFTSDRNATDAGLQLGALFASPLQTGLWWLARFVQDTINVLFLAWGVPLYHLGFNLRLSETWIGFALAFAVAAGVVIALSEGWRREASEAAVEAHDDWRAEMLWVGILSAMAGLIPVILVNRHVEFFSLSRYTLASSVGAAMAVVAMLGYLSSARLRWGLVGLLTGLAVLTHYANAVNIAREADAVRNFWWQVAWRVPQMRDGATLAAQFPASIQEDYFLWGAANLIYHPEPQTAQPIEAPIGAVLLTPENMTRILTRKGMDEPDRRNTHVVMDYGNMLILAQSSAGGCVRVLDGSQPELSASDDPRIMLVAARSRIENVIVDGPSPVPLEAAFGPEPERGWCWYYQQAALARQRGEWALVASLGDGALEKGYYPSDAVEWFPFMQAYAVLGREKDLKQLSTILRADAFLGDQACAILTNMAAGGMMTPEMETSALEWYCR
ncbi:MAG: hypothetical protein HY867_05650 [Chloroflexi bacterium]|nr:hypothetical protein [Chloroflexota bacterium]